MHLCHHFQLELVEFLVPTDTVLMICDLTARLLSSSLPPIPFLIISKQTSNVYLITWKNFDTGVKTKFFANLFHSVKHSFKCLCEEGFYWTVTIVDYIKKKCLDFWFPVFHHLFKFYLFIYLLVALGLYCSTRTLHWCTQFWGGEVAHPLWGVGFSLQWWLLLLENKGSRYQASVIVAHGLSFA